MPTFFPAALRTKIAFARVRSQRTTASWTLSSREPVTESWSSKLQRCTDLARSRTRSGNEERAQADRGVCEEFAEPHYVCRHVYLKLDVEPARCLITAALPEGALVPAWAAHSEGRLAATPEHLGEIVTGRHIAFVYAHADGSVDDAAIPNGSALGCAGLVNRAGNVLAIMPHPERDGWNFNHLDRREGEDVLAPSGGARLFRSFVQAVSFAG